jgi:hypothetical protein
VGLGILSVGFGGCFGAGDNLATMSVGPGILHIINLVTGHEGRRV